MGFIRMHRRAILIFLAVCVLAGAGTLYYLKTSPSAFAADFRAFAGDYISHLSFPRQPELTMDSAVTGETIYVDGTAGTLPDKLEDHDVKVLYNTTEGYVFRDCAAGFSVSLPADMTADMAKSPKFISFESPNAKIVISKEWAYGDNVSEYVAQYFYGSLLDETYRAKNGIELLENTKSDDVERITVKLNGYSGKFDTYTYLTIKTGSRFFFHTMLKYASGDQAAENLVQRVQTSFSYFKPEGTPCYTTDYSPELPENWSGETRALYEKIAASDDLLWGIFTKDVLQNGIAREIPEIEAKLDYKFGIVLAYTSLDGAFPSAFMDRCYNEGRIVELTLQAQGYNATLLDYSPWLELYKTGNDDRIRAFARAARTFGKPFLFRLNNEMNSNWVNYSGIANLLDPDIFVENWRTVYRIFQEEGVNNAIWIFNPNDRDAPPNAWNSHVAYYPGNAYVQLYGVTGYNNGTYYHELWNENWREFDTIYDKIAADTAVPFGAFPWVITEFSSSSIGGDKPKWIEHMFENLYKYPNIKAAVWFSYADYDPKDSVTVSRPYWLDETDETIAAFKHGLEGA